MRHRNFSAPFNTPGIDQHDCNHLPLQQSYIPMGRSVAPENSSSVCPVDHTLRGGVHCETQWTSESRAVEYPPPSLSMEVQHLPPSFSGPHFDPYPHSSIAGSLSLGPVNNVGHVHASHYNRPPTRDVEGGLLNSTTSTGRGSFKRKSPDISGPPERGSSSRFYSAGSSSGSSQMLMEKPSAESHSMPSGTIAVPPYRGSNLSIAGEESVRNVRSRSRLELEPSTARSHYLSHSSHHYHSTTRLANHSAQILPAATSNADATGREWNCVPLYAAASPGRTTTPDISGSSHETNQFFVGGSDADTVGCHRDSVFSRHQVSSSQYFPSPNAQVAREGRHNHSRRSTPSYRNAPSYSHVGNGAPSSSSGPHTPSESFSTRYSRHSSGGGGWRNSYRNGRPRISVERFQSIAGMGDVNDRMGPEAMMIVDHTGFYGGSRNLVDQYRDMRLDIDSMSYEELLALEERIGTVNTGLSEDCMSKCLVEKVHYSSDRSQEDLSCAICLEEYKTGEKVGTMGKCGHDYHVDCIKKWLLMKNVCPICKTECSS